MCWLAYTSDIPPYEKEYNLSTHDIYCYESSSLEPIPTLSIGDIIEILPKEIEEGILNIFALVKHGQWVGKDTILWK